ncbi:MAG TPA: arginine repressor [Gammaproteobacteria bacterium]|nr:arginine repressor [Gammaproteobacteria bacterium]
MTLDEAILKLAEAQEITDQSVFLNLLKREGHKVTQPTLSRHLNKLGVQKLAGRYQRVEPIPGELPAYAVSAAPPNLVIIKTRPGYAQALAVLLDQKAIDGVVGTLAGDDTIFIAVTPEKKMRAAVETVREILERRAAG